MKRYRIGISYCDRELFFLYGYKYFSIYFVKDKKHIYGNFKLIKPTLRQCLYELEDSRNKIKNFIGLEILKDYK